METPLREHSSTAGGRYVETTNGKQLVTDIRMLGCPDELATRIEKRNAERRGEVVPAELDAARVRLAAQAQIPASF